MKNYLLIPFFWFIMLNNINATIWRVNNLPGTDADFTTLQAAHNYQYVYNGDTIYLEASSGSYGNLIATKRLVIFGTGYFLAENANMQANLNSSIIGNITFNAGSEGSVLMGCLTAKIIINASNLIIERNQIIGPAGDKVIEFSGNQNNIIIRRNYILGGSGSSNVGANPLGIQCLATANNVIISNNYIQRRAGTYLILTNSNFSGTIENNIFNGGNITVFNSNINNNILYDGTFTPSNCIYYNNIASINQFGTINGNQQNVNMNNVFVGTSGNSTDGQWQLKVGSPAIGTGVGGVDCGMFGGDFPYKLSGLPNIPAIYYHQQTIDNVNHLLNITIKAKSHN